MTTKMTASVAGHDAHVRAAVQVATDSILRNKIGSYLEPDGWIDWDRLVADLVTGLPWSSGEKQLARLACSLADHMPEGLDDWRQVRVWSLADLLNGLDASNTRVVLDAITFAATGHPSSRAGGR